MAVPSARQEGGDAASAIDQLGKADWLRLEQCARYQVYRYAAINPHEVLAEAVARAMAGERIWPADVALMTFLRGVIRSVADEFREKEKAILSTPDAELTAAMQAEPDGERAPGEDVRLEQLELIRRIWLLFEGDDGAQALMFGVEEGMTAKEVQDQFDLSATDYDAARKRLKRKLDEHFPGGRPR
jgi:DNA-directed RNA polymerase specialized sigma24 family protein